MSEYYHQIYGNNVFAESNDVIGLNGILSWWILTRTSAWILARDQHLPKNDPELMADLYDKLEAMNVPVDVMFER